MLIINAMSIDLTIVIIIKELKKRLECLLNRQLVITAILVGKSAAIAAITMAIICWFIPIIQVIKLEGSATTSTKPLKTTIIIMIGAKIIQQC